MPTNQGFDILHHGIPVRRVSSIDTSGLSILDYGRPFSWVFVVSSGATPKSSPDSQAIGSSEGASVVASVSRSDSQAIGSSENVRPNINRPDSQAIGSSETVRIRIAINDSQAIGSSEARSLSAVLSGADSQAIGSVEGASTGTISKSSTDSQAIGSSETIRLVITVRDTQAIGSVEVRTTRVFVSVADTGTIQSSEFSYEGELEADDDVPRWRLTR